MSKGSGEILNAMLLIIFMLGILGITISTTYGQQFRNKGIIFEEIEILRTKDTFLLTKDSLAMTWFISTVQSIFRTADSNINCATDGLDDGYWYQYRPAIIDGTSSGVKTNRCVDVEACPAIANGKRLSEDDKHNHESYNPRTCAPKKDHVLETMEEKIQPYLGIKREFKSNTADVKITDQSHNLDIDEQKVNGDFSQHIWAGAGFKYRTVTEDDTITPANVETGFYKMVLAGIELVNKTILFSDKFLNDSFTGFTDDSYEYSMRYQENTITSDHETYEDDTKEYIKQTVRDIDPGQNIKTSILFNNYELIVPNSTELGGVFQPYDTGDDWRRGLVLHYNATVTMAEGGDTISTCDTNKPNEDVPGMPGVTFRDIVEDAVGSEWRFYVSKMTYTHNFVYDKEEIIPLIYAIIQQESSWVVDPPDAGAGAIGLMQIMPDTGQDECGLSEAELRDPEENIKCGIKYFKKLMDKYHGKGGPVNRFDSTVWTMLSENAIKLSLAAYNAGFGRVGTDTDSTYVDDDGNRWNSAMKNADSGNYDDIERYLPSETRDYVSKVLAHYICYGGYVSSFPDQHFYYYHDEGTNKFIQRPITLKIKIEDYLPVLDCRERPAGNTANARLFNWNFNVNPQFYDTICCISEAKVNDVVRGSSLLFTCGLTDPPPGIGNNNLAIGDTLSCQETIQDLQFLCAPSTFIQI